MPLIEETQGSIPDPSVALENHPRAEQQNPGSEQSEEKPDLPADEGKNASAPDQEDEEEESDLKGLDKRTTSVTALLHLRCLMNFVDTEIRPKQEYISSSKCSRVYFHDLWFLFKPGDEVIDQMGKQAYVVLRVQIPRHRAEDPWERWNQRAPKHDGSDDEEDDENNGPFTLHCAYIDFDGKNFGPVSKKFQIQPYDELKPIRSLTVRPLRFAEGHNTRKQFIERGRKLLDVSKFKAMYYMGVTLDKRDEIDSQVVIDFHEALLDEERRNAWEPTVAAVTTAADNMGDPCEAPCCENSSVQEGKGLILLLHGAPGVGKTTTAEGIAELFRKPLFQITCGDLGTTAKEVESELEKNFALASRWGCILLLDEADVFLMARDRMDFKRNGLVAVFLRVLEYYSGILILTTNRVGDFDEAFTSRIHMSLYYPELDEVKTLKVFKLNLDLIQKRFEKQGRSLIFDESSIEHFAQKHYREEQHHRWNGRQIRNACQTALALAEYDAQGGTLDINGEIDTKVTVKLQLKYFRTVQKAYLEFGRYMGDIQGTPRDNRAIDHRLRARENSNQQARRSLFSQQSTLRLAVKIYTPNDNPSPQAGDVTIVAAHANGFAKELYEPLWADLHALTTKPNPPFRIRQIIAIDAAWQNASAALNEPLLGNDPGWLDYPRDILHILNTIRPPRPLVGIGHSFGGNSIANLALLNPRLLSTVVLLDPVISRWSANAVGSLAASPAASSAFRRDIWPSRDAARAAFAKSPFYRSWDPRVLEAWITHGLRDTPTPLFPDAAPGSVALATTRHQEVFTYFRPSWEAYAPDGKTLVRPELVPDLDPDLNERFFTFPVYRAEGANTLDRLPHVRPGVLYIFGGTSDLSPPELRDEKMRVTGVGIGGSGGAAKGRVEEVTLPEYGHLVPMEVPAVCAEHAARWIGQELKWWREEQAEFEAWAKLSVKEKTQLTDEWERRLGRPERKGKPKGASKI
ncbi:hypothetical protein ACHAQA_003228 [Verticillium albo-atrum]